MCPTQGGSQVSRITEVKVPDIGDFSDVPVIEILVAKGEEVQVETPLIVLESDKAALEIPSPIAGTVHSIAVSVGQSVSEGTVFATIAALSPLSDLPAPGPPATTHDAARHPQDQTLLTAADQSTTKPSPPVAAAVSPSDALPIDTDPRAPLHRPSPTANLDVAPPTAPRSHATPTIRNYARELGVDLARISGTGRNNRILREDVNNHVKTNLSGSGSPPLNPIVSEPIADLDFRRWGAVETRPLPRIKKISGKHLQQAWLNIPHVTHHDEADITELEAFRVASQSEGETRRVRLSLLAFITKALAITIKVYPIVNTSLATDGQHLHWKQYIHIGIAVDTPNGLIVPVLRDVDQINVLDIAQQITELGARARDGTLTAEEMQGGSISISSLGGIGGIAFTPIINAPEVAILGVSRAQMTPLWNGSEFIPRLILPLSLSYDHRVIDGAEAARFVAHLTRLLTDIRRLLL